MNQSIQSINIFLKLVVFRIKLTNGCCQFLTVKTPPHHWFFGAQPGHRTQQRPIHMGGNLTKIERGYLRNEHHRAKILGTLMRCANIFETQHHQHIAVKKKKKKWVQNLRPSCAWKFSVFFPACSPGIRIKKIILVTLNGLLHVSLQNRHNKNQLRHTDRGCLSHVVAHVRERSHQKVCQYDALLVVLQASTMYALNGLKSIAAIVWQSVSVVK